MKELTPDLCVIGAGSAGLTLTAAARAIGYSVVLVEKDRMGGECLNTGCVPSKALIAAARHAQAIRRAEDFGITSGPVTVDYRQVHAGIQKVIATIAPHDSEERFAGLGATVIRAAARFIDDRTVEAGEFRIRARKYVIATGSRPLIPDIPGLAGTDFLTNESLFDLAALPAHLAIIGAGPVGMEMAQAFNRLGSKVTLIARGRPLGNDPADMAEVVTARLRREGVRILTETRVAEVSSTGSKITLRLDGPAGEEKLGVTHVFVASGRRPMVEGLDLDKAGVTVGPRGIVTDSALRSSNRRIFAAGDVAGSFRFTHWASYQAGLIIRTILTRWPHRENRAAIVWVTFTEPELAHVGLTEAGARARGGPVDVITVPFKGNDRAIADQDSDGFMRLITGRRGRILGADIVGPAAGELIGTLALAVSKRLTLSDIAGTVLPYPTLQEITRRGALEGLKLRLGGPILRTALGLLRRLS